MAITLRELATGNAVGEGFKARRVFNYGVFGGWYEVDSFSIGTYKVYARSAGHTPAAPVQEFNPSELGLYIGHGHERGEPVSSIKWGGQEFRSRVQFTDDELLDVHMALRYLIDNGCEPVSILRGRADALIRKIGRLPGHNS